MDGDLWLIKNAGTANGATSEFGGECQRAQYLDPELVGPLFRFNRDFYELDESRRPY